MVADPAPERAHGTPAPPAFDLGPVRPFPGSGPGWDGDGGLRFSRFAHRLATGRKKIWIHVQNLCRSNAYPK
jgi:hypothetical protein